MSALTLKSLHEVSGILWVNNLEKEVEVGGFKKDVTDDDWVKGLSLCQALEDNLVNEGVWREHEPFLNAGGNEVDAMMEEYLWVTWHAGAPSACLSSVCRQLAENVSSGERKK